MEARLCPIEEKYLFIIGKVFFKIFVKIHLFANSREHQHFVPIEFVGGGVARTIKIIFFILIDFLIPFVTQGFNNLFFILNLLCEKLRDSENPPKLL